MKRVALVSFAVSLLAALLPIGALAKGASGAEITGPGLDKPISLAGEGRPGGEQLGQLAETAGFFPAVFARSPDPMLDQRPAGDLGPRYTITYVMPGPYGEEDRILQDVYPYAKPNPVTHTASGQPFYGTEKTRGGWFVASPMLKEELIAAGLPERPPVGVDGGGIPWTVTTSVAALAAALVLAGAGAFALRRRGRAATA